jgi:molecular chaperone HtpG
MTDDKTPHSHAFQAEVAELLNLMVHSVYSETDIFLRELISNASDACDKLRYEAISKPELLAGPETGNERLVIRLVPDAKAGTLAITDTGIGMTEQELVDNLGTIARSGTKAFVQALSEAKDGMGLIGKFGVGFYAVFMVAAKVEVTSRRAGSDQAFVWRSEGGAGFEIAPADEAQAARVPRGTEVLIHLKDDAKKYAERFELERIVRTYSDHILFPIELSDDDGDKKGEARQINAASAPWQRSKSEMKPEDYTEAYKSIATAFDEPALTLHYRAEGRQSYAVMLFVPSMRPFDLADPARKGRIKLYVRRVYITDDAELLPPWLRFVRGVIDSEDLPLNVSREMLQNNPQVTQIRNAVTGRVLGELELTADKDAAKYKTIWDAFGPVIKEGLYEDHEKRAQLLNLCRFASSASDEPRSLKQYVADLKPNQTEIYYLVGESLERLRANPKLEAAKARGIEVLLLADPIDAFWTIMPSDYEGKPLKSLSQGDVDFSLVPLVDKDAASPEASEADKGFIDAVKGALGDQVSDVRASHRLTDSAACLVAAAGARDRELERLLARQERSSGAKPILELNMKHALVKALARSVEEKKDDVDDLSAVLLAQAQILDGEVPPDPAAFARRLNDLIVRGLRPS